jgi:hypothetical protein
VRSIVVAGLLVACSAPPKPPAPAPAPPTPQRDLAVAEPPPKQPTPAAESDLDFVIERQIRVAPNAPIRRRTNQTPQEIDIAEHELWSPCVRDYVQARRDESRRALTAVFARYATTCNADRHVVVARPSEYRGSYVAYRGTFAPDRTDVELEIVACGTTAALDSVTLVADRKRWSGNVTSQEVGGCTVATMPDLRALRRALRDALDAKLVIVEIDGEHDIVITDEMKRDLRLMLDALDAISAR